MKMEALTIENLSKIYSNGKGIREVNLNVEKGKIHALLGNNGVGKNTTMKCIMGIIFPESGRIEIDGEELVNNNPSVKSHIGYSSDIPSFPRNLTGKECMQTYGYLKGLDKAEIKNDVNNLLEEVDLLDVSDIKVSKYSRGMMQRLDLAVALLGNPDLLILDEPTAGLDPSSASKLRYLLREFVSEGKTVLLSDHQLTEVEKLCSNATIIDGGRTVLQSKMSDLLKNMKGSFKYVAEFSFLDDEIIKHIGKLEGVVSVDIDKNLKNVILIYTEKQNGYFDEITRISRNTGSSLYSLTEGRISLEDIFLSIVKNEK